MKKMIMFLFISTSVFCDEDVSELKTIGSQSQLDSKDFEETLRLLKQANPKGDEK